MSASRLYDQPDTANSESQMTGPLQAEIQALTPTFHPKLNITLHLPSDTPLNRTSGNGCYAFISFSLPDEVFIDRDEVAELWGSEAKLDGLEMDGSLAGYDGLSRSEDEGRQSESAGLAFGVKAWMLTPEVIDIERPVKWKRNPAIPAEVRSPVNEASKIGAESGRNTEVMDEPLSKFSVAMVMNQRSKELVIQMHARYLAPNPAGQQDITIFGGEEGAGVLAHWACGMSTDPTRIFRKRLGKHTGGPDSDEHWIEGPDGSACFVTTYYSVHPVKLPHPITLQLPNGHPSHLRWIEPLTAGIIWLGLAYLVWKVWQLMQRSNSAAKAEIHKSKTE